MVQALAMTKEAGVDANQSLMLVSFLGGVGHECPRFLAVPFCVSLDIPSRSAKSKIIVYYCRRGRSS